ncbi:hypothetical protein QYE76_056120 [Lolium multiflorum]|uniref:Integrase catalytic domain-containing protein n=1 Tax=Lolium multiflorum TaxID=4521 RepID=A0AAD8WMX4_LOLMU|nr:hypothetical protein QYE76_056120 [Lolium multiflorum]
MMEFANQIQRKYDTTILAIRSDNGTEFKNYTLDDFLGEEGIQHQYSSPYTTQQNGVAERKNRTLIEAARTMMMEYKSKYNFWAEAISTACHATNRLYFRKGLEKTPYEILTGNKPNVSYFKEGWVLEFADLKNYLLCVPGKDQVPPNWSNLYHKAKLLPLIKQVQANLYFNLKFNLKFDINNNKNQVQVNHYYNLKFNINNRKLIYHNNNNNNNRHQVIKAKLQVLHQVIRG